MAKFERVEDHWKDLRKDLYGNVEPSVELRAITMPIEKVKGWGNNLGQDAYKIKATERLAHVMQPVFMDFSKIEELPAVSAGVSYGATEKLENDSERAIKLNKKLIADGHDTPLEAIQLNFRIKGLSKTAGAQLSRYRTGNGHVSASRRFRTAEAGFVYPILDYINDEDIAKDKLAFFSHSNRLAFDAYKWFKSDQMLPRGTGGTPEQIDFWNKLAYPLHKEDARQVLPVSYATSREWWVNVRALRYIFKQRLKADTESELRRLCWMIYDMVCPLMPSLFEDIVDSVTCERCKRTLKIDNTHVILSKEQRTLIESFVCSDCLAPY